MIGVKRKNTFLNSGEKMRTLIDSTVGHFTLCVTATAGILWIFKNGENDFLWKLAMLSGVITIAQYTAAIFSKMIEKE